MRRVVNTTKEGTQLIIVILSFSILQKHVLIYIVHCQRQPSRPWISSTHNRHKGIPRDHYKVTLSTTFCPMIRILGKLPAHSSHHHRQIWIWILIICGTVPHFDQAFPFILVQSFIPLHYTEALHNPSILSLCKSIHVYSQIIETVHRMIVFASNNFELYIGLFWYF